MKVKIGLIFLLSLLLPFGELYAVEKKENKTEPVMASHAMVVSAHPEATKIGLNVLKKGGNAFDAMLAVELALAVSYPSAGNIAGGGFLVYRLASGETGALDYREKAPLAAHRDMFLDKEGNPLKLLKKAEAKEKIANPLPEKKRELGRENIRSNPNDVTYNRSVIGSLAVGVPGTVAGIIKAQKRFGKLNLKELVQPAIDLAKRGVILTQKEADKLNAKLAYLNEVNRHISAYQRKTRWTKGDTLHLSDLSATLERIRDYGKAGFYKGETAKLIVDEIKSGGGIMTLKDLELYEAKWRTPIKTKYRDYDLTTMSPPSSGGIILAQILKMMEPYNFQNLGGFQSDSLVQLMVEAERRAYADRAEHLGDIDFVDVPIIQMLDAGYLKTRMKDFSFNKASVSDNIFAGKPRKESEQTTHYSVVDKWGNAVSVTTTLNGAYGSKVVVKGGGFLLNNQMDDFSIKPGYPNMFGLLGTEANAIAPEKRMLSSMTPTILTKNGKFFATVGTPGGSTIITSVAQTIINLVDFKMNAQKAVSAPRFHHQWKPDRVYIEKGIWSQDKIDRLSKKGYHIDPRGYLGKVEVIVKRHSKLEAGADHRGDDTAMGY